MANVSQGVTVTWGGVSLGEVINVNLGGISADSVEVTPRAFLTRYKIFSPADVDLGTVSVTARGTACMSSTNVGLTATLSIGGPGVSFSFDRAIFQNLAWSASVGEMQTYAVTFKLGDSYT